jgi:hypothetical protein
MVFPKDNSIRMRNKTVALENEALLWRALCDSGKSLERYLAADAVFMLPGGDFDNGNGPRLLTMDAEEEPTLVDYLNSEFKPWTTYKFITEPEFVEVDMMATSVVYKVELGRLNAEDKLERSRAVASSVWRQDSAGDWKVCMHHLSFL